ncbi:SDR family NAD(P)-dependent oxidoreductase [uncultured Microbacterium sp.]|uniref:SDR family NAD(P)-dependent oxidoreductase n=1 Tax=uncultured Microbacterium sp. TaxID=191216 RepID=UPI0035CC0DC6
MVELTRRTVLIAGATSTSGLAAARALTSAGARVVAVGHDPQKLEGLGAAVPGIRTEVCDLSDENDVQRLADRIHETRPVDGVLHLVGGWRGGGGLAAQSDADYRFLERSFTALRYVTRVFDADLRASDAGRLAVVSSTTVARPLAGGANYTAMKAATEAWTRAVAQGFAKAARDAGEPLRAASVIFRVAALDGLEERLAATFVELWAADAAGINDTIVDLSAG